MLLLCGLLSHQIIIIIIIIILVILKILTLLTIAKRLQTIRRITTLCLALAQGHYTHGQHRLAETLHQ